MTETAVAGKEPEGYWHAWLTEFEQSPDGVALGEMFESIIDSYTPCPAEPPEDQIMDMDGESDDESVTITVELGHELADHLLARWYHYQDFDCLLCSEDLDGFLEAFCESIVNAFSDDEDED